MTISTLVHIRTLLQADFAAKERVYREEQDNHGTWIDEHGHRTPYPRQDAYDAARDAYYASRDALEEFEAHRWA